MKVKKFINKHKISLSFLLLLIGFSFFMMSFFIKESDYSWHITAGKYMVSHKTILKEDIFSWYLSNKTWMSHEWLFEVLIYYFKTIFLEYHVFVYAFCTIFSLFCILFFSNRNNYLKNIPFSLFWISLGLIFFVFIQARPHMISFIFLSCTIYFGYDLYSYEDSKKIYFLPLIAFLWSNFHGGSSNLSYLFCLLFMIVGLFQFSFSKIETRRMKKCQFFKYGLVVLACIFCICLNPHGVKMLIYPYTNMLDNLMISNISEWQPTVLSDFSHYPYFLLLVIIISVFLFSKRKIQLVDLLLFSVVCFLGLKSIRFWAYTYIVMSYVVFNYVSYYKSDKGSCVLICFLGIIFFFVFLLNRENLNKNLQKELISKKMISVIKRENPKRLYNMYNYGGELIYNGIDVFVDGRADLYSKYNLEDAFNISRLDRDYIKLIDKYDFDYFLVSKNYPIYNYLKYSTSYEELYRSLDVVFYKKRD